MDEPGGTGQAAPPLTRRKTKGKAPLPPTEVKQIGKSTTSDVLESTSYIMEQKENMIDKEVELTVVLPGDVTTSTTVNGSKPMMDLLVFLCGQYHLNPSTYTVDLISTDKSQIIFKPNTPIGMLEVERAILKPKNVDEKSKRSTPIMPEQSVRVVINYKKTQKTVMRVSPHVSLQELTPTICSKCEFDPLHTVLLKDYQSQEPLDLTKSLNDLGLRELYAVDNSRGTSADDMCSSSLHDSYEISQQLNMLKQKGNERRFFSLFRRSKKKREQISSAPATPLLSVQRPASLTRSSTLTRQYDSNTLPLEMPKKRRAPLPPMHVSQSVQKDMDPSRLQSGSLIVKSVSVDETDKEMPGIRRTGSLQLSSTSSSSSSLKRTKRKAPLPPSPTSKIQQAQNDENSNETVLESAESVQLKVASEGEYAEVQSPTALVGCEYNLKEIDEKGETSAHHTEEMSTFTVSTESTVSAPENATVNNGSGEEKQDDMNLNNMEVEVHSAADRKDGENVTLEESKQTKVLDPNEDTYSKDITIEISNEKEEYKNKTAEVIAAAAENVRLQDDRPSCYQESENDNSLLQGDDSRLIPERKQQTPNEANTNIAKTQDVAIQTASCFNGVDQNILNEMADPQAWRLPALQNEDVSQNTVISNSLQESTVEKPVLVCHSQKQETVHDSHPIRESTNMHTNTYFTLKSNFAQNPLLSPTKTCPVYRQNSESKPKPSNEITREYIPKIGMTTYKIVPQGSLEALKGFVNDSTTNKKNKSFEPQSQNAENSLKYNNTKESGFQTGNHFVSEGLPQSGKQYESPVALNGTGNFSDSHATVSSLKRATAAGQTEMNNDFRKELATVLEKSNNGNTSFETKEKQNSAYPKMKQNSFYLQMQRRVSGLYVESAVAKKANAATSPTQKDPKFKELEKNVLSPHKTIQFVDDLSQAATESAEKNSDCVHGKKVSEEVSVLPPIKEHSPSHLPVSRSLSLNLEKLRTFATPRPYSSTTPSPFARAVSSAVKRSQSFSKSGTTVIQTLEEESCKAFSTVTSSSEVKNPLSPKLFGNSKESGPEQKANTASSQLTSQVPCLVHHSTSVLEKKTTLPVQNYDPEQIHQSLMAAICSGEAAARLKRVSVPSNTMLINGGSRLSHQVSSEVQYEH